MKQGDVALIELLIHLALGNGPGTGWLTMAAAILIGAFVVYVGAALAAALTTRDAKRASICRQILRDLLSVIRPRRS